MIVLVTGGAGSIGRNLVIEILKHKNNYVIAVDNNEYGLSTLEMDVKETFYSSPDLVMQCLKTAVGDIRDKERMEELLEPIEEWGGKIDAVIHTAAMKRIEMAEHNVAESIKTNVLGTINLVKACQKAKTEKFLLISSDKAVPAQELSGYGATKFLQEKIVLSAKEPPIFSVTRFGNVIGTRGDVLEIWRRQMRKRGPISITDKKMRRFWWTMQEAVGFIINCVERMEGKEIFVPEMKEYNIVDFAMAQFGRDIKYLEVGLRKGEVLVHELMTPNERLEAKREDWGWVIKK